jgi:hypothetical protein
MEIVVAKLYHLPFSVLVDKYDENKKICVILTKNNQ